MCKSLKPSVLFKRLCKKIGSLGSVLVAYSGGVDSTLVVKAAKDAGARFLTVFCDSPLVPSRLKKQAKDVATRLRLPFLVIQKDELKDGLFCTNPMDRCYICKRGLFSMLKNIADERGFDTIAVGTNVDDLDDFRPGMKAEEEFRVARPLLECGMGKREIRAIARYLRLPNAEAPSEACLASRIPFNSPITRKKLEMVDAAEEFLNRLGFAGCRVRNHETLARIELRTAGEFRKMTETMRRRIFDGLKKIGFEYVTLDMLGYRK